MSLQEIVQIFLQEVYYSDLSVLIEDLNELEILSNDLFNQEVHFLDVKIVPYLYEQDLHVLSQQHYYLVSEVSLCHEKTSHGRVHDCIEGLHVQIFGLFQVLVRLHNVVSEHVERAGLSLQLCNVDVIHEVEVLSVLSFLLLFFLLLLWLRLFFAVFLLFIEVNFFFRTLMLFLAELIVCFIVI